MIVKAPNRIPFRPEDNYIFLAGTIDNGNSEDWQEEAGKRLDSDSSVILNPRREYWDSSWVQSTENKEFVQQVEWELHGMSLSGIVIFNFLPKSQSMITLLELGLRAPTGKCYVCCPDEYCKSGNVHIICDMYDLPLFKNMEDLLKEVKSKL